MPDVINNFNEDGFESRYPRYAEGRPPTSNLPKRRAIKRIALSRPADHGQPFSTWSLAMPASPTGIEPSRASLAAVAVSILGPKHPAPPGLRTTLTFERAADAVAHLLPEIDARYVDA